MQNNNEQIDLTLLLKQIWGQRKKIVRYALIGVIVGLVVGFSIPKEYESYTKIAPETQTKGISGSAGALASIMGYNLDDNGSGISEKLYPEVMGSSPFLMEFAGMKVPYDGKQVLLQEYLKNDISKAWWSYIWAIPSNIMGWVKGWGAQDRETDFATSNAQQQAFCKSLSSRISVTLDSKVGLYTIKARFQTPEIARLVADSLYYKLQKYVISYKTKKTRFTLTENIANLHRARIDYYRADSLYAKAVDKNQNLISKSATIKIDRLENERNLAYQVYQQLATQVETDKIRLTDQTPIATIIEPAKLPVNASSPKKMIIMVTFAFLLPLVYVLVFSVKSQFNEPRKK